MANKKYQVTSSITVGEKDADTGEVTTRELQPGATITLSEDEAYELRHALKDAPTQPSKLGAVKGEDGEMEGGRELEDEEFDALESIRKRPDNAASGVLLHWKTDSLAVATAERRAADAEAVAPNKRGAAGEAADNTEAVEHGFQRAAAGPGSTTDPAGLSGNTGARPRANMTEMEKEDAPKIRAQEAADLKKKRDMAKATSSMGAAKKPVTAPPAGGSNNPPPPAK